MLRDAKAKGYRFLLLKETDNIDKIKRCMILRHDVDFSLERAFEMAKIEKKLGIRSTYFIRLHAPYNPFDFKNYSRIMGIINMGHEIGLHFEAVDMAAISKERAEDIFMKEKEVLERIFDVKIVSCAEHRDFTHIGKLSFFDKADNMALGIRYNAYDKVLMGKVKYISDSLGNWREGCLCNHIGKQDKLYVLTHPSLWFYNYYHTW